MKITFWKGLFVADTQAAGPEAELLKKVGFIWHDPKRRDGRFPHRSFSCNPCRSQIGMRWWTKRTEVAARVKSYCNKLALDALAEHIKTVDASWATTSDYEFPVPPWKITEGKDYLPYQKAGIAYAISSPTRKCKGHLNADEPGLGKTIQALGVINTLQQIENVLVVCPARLRINWMREAFGDPTTGRTGWVYPQERTFKPFLVTDDAPVPDDANFVVVNYERLVIGTLKCGVCKGDKKLPCKDCDGKGLPSDPSKLMCDGCKGKALTDCTFCQGEGRIPGNANRAVVDSLLKRNWDYLIIDEGHKTKNKDAGRTITVLGTQEKQHKYRSGGLQSVSNLITVLSGTPLVNGRPIEMHPYLSAIAPEKFGLFFPFARRYGGAREEVIGGGSRRWKFDGASRLPELQESLRGTCMIRRLKRDVLPELPSKSREIVVLPPDGALEALREEQEEWSEEFEDDVELAKLEVLFAQRSGNQESYRKAAEQLKYVLKVAFDALSRVRHKLALAKLPACLDHTEAILDDVDKIIIFAHHRDVIEKAFEHFGKDIAVRLYGGMPINEAQASVDRFQSDPKCRVFIGQIDAAGEGITLTQARGVLFYEMSWLPSALTQCEDRAHRIGQLYNVFVQQLVIDGSLDAKFVHTIIAKQDAADAALDLPTHMREESLGTPLVQEREFPKVPDQEKRLLKKGLFHLASIEAFSMIDGSFGRQLAAKRDDFSDAQAYGAKKLCHKYRRRLPEDISKGLSMWESPEQIAAAEAIKKARAAERRKTSRKDDRDQRQLDLPAELPPAVNEKTAKKKALKLERLSQDIDHHKNLCPLCDDTGLCTTAIDIEARIQKLQGSP